MCEREKLMEVFNCYLDTIRNDINPILGSAIESDRQLSDTKCVLKNELFRTFRYDVDVLFEQHNDKLVEKIFTAVMASICGRVLTIIEGCVDADRRQPVKDITRKALWQNYGANLKNLKEILIK